MNDKARLGKKVLFICTWGIGNMIQTTPTIQAIHDLGYDIDLYANPVFPDQYDLLEGWSIINRIYIYPKENPNFSTYDHLVYHHPARVEKFSDYKKYKNSGIIIENGHPDPFWANEIKANLELAVKLGRNPFAGTTPKCHVEHTVPIFMPEVRYDHSNPDVEKMIVLAPTTHGKNDLWGPKMWHYWPEFIQAMAEERPKWNFYIVGSKDDQNQPPEVDKPNIFNMIGKLGIKEVAGLIKISDLVVCNETGIGWIADALDVPCLTLWTCTDMKKNWVQSEKRVVVFKPVCQLQPCHHPTRIPGLFCPYIKAGKPHPCGYSFTTNQVYGLMMKVLGIDK